MARVFLVFILFFSINSQAEVIKCTDDVAFNSQLGVRLDSGQTTTLSVNGIGKKRVLFFSVFFAAFYLENPTDNAEEILNSDEIKVGIIHTLMAVSKKRMINIWNQEFERLCEDQCDELRPYHEKFISYARDVEKNERLYMIIFPDRFEFEANHKEFYDPIYSPGYAHLMQRVLIGPDASDKNLEKALLGKTPYCKN